MKLYTVEGTLNQGFVGQISYTICLNHPLRDLDIHFQFDKQRYQESTPILREAIQTLCRTNYQMNLSDQAADQMILNDCKTEIHTMATLNDTFIGCVHKQLTDRHMFFTNNDATEGCIPQTNIEGVLKVTLLIFNCIQDQTHYQLTVNGTETKS